MTDGGLAALHLTASWRRSNNCPTNCEVNLPNFNPAILQIHAGNFTFNLNNVFGNRVLALKQEKVDPVDHGVYFCADLQEKNYMQIAHF